MKKVLLLCTFTLGVHAAFGVFPAPPPIARVEIASRAVLINGQPFFPLMAWLQDPKNFQSVKDCGMNSTAGYWPHAGGTKDVAEYLQKVHNSGLYGVMPYDPKLKGDPALLAYIQGDEPDLTHQTALGDVVRATPEETVKEYQKIKSADPSRPVFMTLTGDFDPFFKKRMSDEERQSLYASYIPACDAVGYDIYPIYGWNKPEWIYLVDEATDRLVKMAGPRPVYTWIETSKGGQWTGALEGQKEVTPADIRAEVWMAICRGATAIGYFTHVWKPSYNQFGVPEENRKALRKINDQITRLAPVILSAPPKEEVTIQSCDGVKLDVMARKTDHALTIFTVNFDERMKAATAAIHLNGLKAGTTIRVVDEGRTIQSNDGIFNDTFAPLAVHIYEIVRWPPGNATGNATLLSGEFLSGEFLNSADREIGVPRHLQ